MRYSITILLIICSFLGEIKAQDKIDLLFRSEKILSSGDTVRAIDAFSEVLRLFPQSFAASLRLAEISFATNRYTEAVQYCNVSIDIIDDLITSQEKSLRILGLPSDSSNRVRRFSTDQAYIHHLKGTIRIAQGRLVDAEHEFRRSIDINSTNNKALLDLALLLSNQGRYKESKLLLRNATSTENKSTSVRMNLASLHESLGETDSAIFQYNKVIQADSMNPWPYLSLGKIYAEQLEISKAIANYSLFISLDTTSAEVYYRRAVLYTDQKKWNEALNDWNKTLSINESADSYRNRGLTQFQLEEYQLAIEDFRKALLLEPDQPYTQINRGYCYYLINKPKKALDDVNAGLNIVPNYYLGHYFKSLILFQLRKKKKSCSSLTRAIELGLKDSGIDKKLLKKCF